MKKINLYLGGKVKKTSIVDRNGGWRKKLIDDLFGVDIIGIGLDSYDHDPNDMPIIEINNKYEMESEFNYVGPYLYGCDHSCSHGSDYAHGVSTCCPDKGFFNELHGVPNMNILKISLLEIDRCDIFIANFNEKPMESYGLLAEIGYAYGNGKKIFGIGNHEIELWFAQGMCEMCENVDDLREKINIWIGQNTF